MDVRIPLSEDMRKRLSPEYTYSTRIVHAFETVMASERLASQTFTVNYVTRMQ